MADPFAESDVKWSNPGDPEKFPETVDIKIDPIYGTSFVSIHIDKALIRPGRVIHVGEPLVDDAPEGGVLKVEHFTALLEDIYKYGVKPDQCWTTPEIAYERGLITLWEYRWLKFRLWLRGLFSGTSKPSAPSGARSAPPTPGTPRTAPE